MGPSRFVMMGFVMWGIVQVMRGVSQIINAQTINAQPAQHAPPIVIAPPPTDAVIANALCVSAPLMRNVLPPSFVLMARACGELVLPQHAHLVKFAIWGPVRLVVVLQILNVWPHNNVQIDNVLREQHVPPIHNVQPIKCVHLGLVKLVIV